MDVARLKGLAASLGAVPYAIPPALTLVALPVDHTPGIEQARELLAKRRRANPGYRDPGSKFSRRFKTDKRLSKELDTSQWEFSQAENNGALQEAIDADKPLAVIAALIRAGAVTDFAKALPKAVISGRSDLVNLLLSNDGRQSIQSSLDKCLALALDEVASKGANPPSEAHLSMVSDLVACGARVLEDRFARALEQQQTDIVAILLQGKEPCPPDYLSQWLYGAVVRDNYRLLSMLLAYGADPNLNDARCLLEAVRPQKLLFTAVILAHAADHPIDTNHITACLEIILESVPPTSDFNWLQLFLAAGAMTYTEELAKRLRRAVELRQADMVQLLVHYDTPTTSPAHNALEAAIYSNDRHMTQLLLREGTIPTTMVLDFCKSQQLEILNLVFECASFHDRSSALCFVIQTCLPRRLFMVQQLLLVKCSITAVNDSLILAVSKGRLPLRSIDSGSTPQGEQLGLLQLLLSYGADVNHSNAAAARAAIDTASFDVLEILMKADLPATTVDLIFAHARSVLQTDEARHQAYSIILSSSSFKPSQLDDALIDAAQEPSQDMALWQLLLDRGASVNYKDGEALQLVINSHRPAILYMLLEQEPTKDIVSRSLLSAMNVHPIARLKTVTLVLTANPSEEALDEAVNQATEERETDLVHVILKHHDPLGPKADVAVSHAAVSGDSELLEALLNHVKGHSLVSKAMDAMTTQHKVQNLSTGIECARLLLAKGPAQRCVDAALSVYIESNPREMHEDEYVDLLLSHHADVNSFDGKIMQSLAKSGNKTLFLKMLDHGVTSQTLTTSLPLLFASGMLEEDIVEIINACFTHSKDSSPSIDESGTNDPLTYLAMKHYPTGYRLLQTLLYHQYSPNWRRKTNVIDPDVEEDGNALICALALDREQNLSIDIIRTLLESNVDVNYASRKSRVTPLMMASSNNRVDFVNLFFQYGAEVNYRDAQGKTALLYASENGHLDVVRRLTSAGAKANDGSLLEAARELQADVVDYLLGEGHTQDYPSRLHDGRSALLELLLRGQVRGPNDRLRFERILRALLAAGADVKIDYKGKNALYCILDSQTPFEVLDMYLETDHWRDLDDRSNWWTDDAKKCYSPTMYLFKGPWYGDEEERAKLYDLLAIKRCKDRYFAWEGDQPPGAVGFPEDIAEKERKKQALLEEHNLRLRIERETLEHKLDLEKKKNALFLAQEEQRAAKARDLKEEEHVQRSRHESQLAVQRRTITDSDNAAALAHQQSLTRLRNAELEKRIAAEHGLVKAQEAAAERQGLRQMRLMERNDESRKKENQLQLETISAQQGLMNQAQGTRMLAQRPQWGDESPD